MAHRLSALALAALACTGGAPSDAPEPAEAPAPAGAASPATHPVERPALVVLVVVDQLADGQIARLEGRMAGGLARLSGPEAFVATAEHRHASTETCPGHATIATGANPDVHGIVGNGFLMYGQRTYCLDATPMPVQSIGDVARAGGGMVVSLSIKDRGATLLAGQDPTLAVWLDRKKAMEVAGTYGAAAPLAPPLVPKDTWVGWLQQPWTLTDPTLPEWSGIPDDQPHEDGGTLGATFPHRPVAEVLKPPELANGLVLTPAGGDYLTAAALEATTRLQLGADDTPDLLTVSYSQYDGVGHQFTPASLESLDAMLKLDAQLGALMDGLDARVGAGRWAMLLTADHGVPDGVPTYLDLDALPKAISEAFEREGLPAPAAFMGAGMHLADGLTPEQRARSLDVARAVVTAVEGVEDLVDRRAPVGEFAASYRASWFPGRTPDASLLLAPGAVPVYKGVAKGTTHGAPRGYDQRVPFLAWGAGVNPGAGGVVDVRQIAPTAARLLGTPAPDGAQLGPVEAALR